MRRLFLSLAAIWATLGTAFVTLSTDFASEWLKKHPSLNDIEGLVRPHLLIGIACLSVLGLFTLLAWLGSGTKAASEPDSRVEVKPQIEVSPTILPTISPNFTFSPTVQVPVTAVATDSKARAPHQLRPPPLDFTGRVEDVQELPRAVREQSIRILALRGMGGIGKTALALKIAETLTPDFPDGQIHLDLKGAPHKGDSPGVRPLTTGEAMDHVIRSYNPEAPVFPNDDAREAEYQSTLFGKHALLLMDNARDRDQLERLIPPAGSVMVVTSRDHFTMPGLTEKDLQKLPPHDAHDLMLKIAPRIRQHADDFAKLCDYLPEALRNTASAIAERPALDPQDFLRRMSDNQMRLDITGVELSLTTSSELLDPALRRRWLLLGVFPDTFDYNAAAAVWECAPEAAKDGLSDLLRYRLIEWNSVTSRYRLHDLARDFTTLRLEEPMRIAAQGRHAAYYKDVLAAVDQKYLSGGALLSEGLALFDLEWGNIQAGQAWAAAYSERDEFAAQLCEAYPDIAANVLSVRQPPRQRIEWLEAASDSARRLRHREHETTALGNLGLAYHALGEYGHAIEFHERALAISREIGDRRSEGQDLGNLGLAYHGLGEYPRAIEFFEQVLAIAREISDRRGEGNSLGNLGNAYCALSVYHRATEFYEQQLAIARDIGDRSGESNALYNSALTLNELGDRAEAIRRAEQALVILMQIESPEAERVRRQLAAWRKPI